MTAWSGLAACSFVPLGPQGAVPTPALALTQGSPATPVADGKARLQGTVFAPGGALGYRTAGSRAAGCLPYRVAGYRAAGCRSAYEQDKAAGILVYLSTPDERLYVDTQGKIVSTTTDAAGNYDLPAALGQPLIVTAVLAGNRRLVGFTKLSTEGAASLDVTLATTYATEFARAQALRTGKTIGDLDLARLAQGAALTGSMLEARELDRSPDLAMSEVPALIDKYLVAFSSSRRDVADLWAGLLGFRPLGVSTLEDSVDPGFDPTAIAINPAGTQIYVAMVSNTGVMIREVGRKEPTFRGLVAQGFWDIETLAVGPDGRIYFAQRVDRYQGGALSKNDNPPQLRVFCFQPGDPEIEEIRLAVPAELASYAADTSLRTRMEPASLAWHGGKLYVSDFETGLIYEYTSGSGLWTGRVVAGRLTGGPPAHGRAPGAAQAGAAVGPRTPRTRVGDDLYFADADNGVIRALQADGSVRDVVGTAGNKGFEGDGGSPLQARLAYPGGTAFDAQGRMFVADSENHRLRLVADGKIRTIVGGGKGRGRDGDALDVNVGAIGDLKFDSAGNLLFTDTGTGKVRKLWLQYGL